ncbi:Glycosyl hydrolase family 65, N-terminal domain [Neorhodopirellula lusitana]|uniref:Glycosyl hydrolase family 65, N-terminal domain n=1 Tax=Neorhodopirellula lusitana TaxID=445327 RepID=A0ABY1QHN8_9BACT|nr:glycoside hydrolase N-terminal domain-containing protein [Neorhodopirellula lusitana]SMP68997.1 Glycosyl hydrolase family 65, N-terminal domain [Neorhodopirellula lusitana]
MTISNPLIIVLTLLVGLQIGFADDTRLWYEQPAQEWTQGLPLGNGRLMAIVQGGVQKETIQFNDDTSVGLKKRLNGLLEIEKSPR